MRKLLTAAVVAAVAAFGTVSAKAAEFTMVTGVDPGFSIFYVGHLGGFTKKNGLDTELKTGPSGGASVPLLIGHQSNASMAAALAGINNHLVDNNICAVAQIVTLDRWYGIVASDEIKKIEDLKGQKIGVTIGTGSETLWQAVLDHYKLDYDAYNEGVVNVEPPEMAAAIERGDIVAFANWEPWLSRATLAIPGTHILVDNKQVGLYDVVFIYMNRKYIDENRDKAKMFMKSMIDANNHIVNDAADTKNIVGEFLNLSPDLMNQLYPKLTYKVALDQQSFDKTKEVLQQMLNQGRLKDVDAFDFNKWFCADLLKEVDPDRVKLPADMKM